MLCHNLSNLSLFVGCLHCFQAFGTINYAAVNILVHKFICISHDFLWINSVSGFTGSKDGERRHSLGCVTNLFDIRSFGSFYFIAPGPTLNKLILHPFQYRQLVFQVKDGIEFWQYAVLSKLALVRIKWHFLHPLGFGCLQRFCDLPICIIY